MANEEPSMLQFVQRKGLKSFAGVLSNIRLLKQQSLIELVNDILATLYNIEHYRHRNLLHGLTNFSFALIAHQYLQHKPHLIITHKLGFVQKALCAKKFKNFVYFLL